MAEVPPIVPIRIPNPTHTVLRGLYKDPTSMVRQAPVELGHLWLVDLEGILEDPQRARIQNFGSGLGLSTVMVLGQ